ncbi:hypothetical protein IKF89_00245 [Candidatus Saccharibacteria bacterium]|nr:hypothetical protein [Candidatus Saccharibacteria bacterium]
MAESEKKTTKKATPKETEPSKDNKASTQSIVIAVLATVLVCLVLVFGVLLASGVIKFGNSGDTPGSGTEPTKVDNLNGGKTGGTTTGSKIINNPNQRVTVKDSTLASVKDLEFYLPDDFKAGDKNNDGAYTYNLVDDDGWAQVLVYAEKSNLTPEKYLMKITPYLDITDTNYVMNGTHWVVGENANALAYATELDGMIYAVYYSVKLDSDDTSEAMQMIPKTLYMKKIYSE